MGKQSEMALDIKKLESGLGKIFSLKQLPKEGHSERPLDTNDDFAKEFVDVFMEYFIDVEAELTHAGERIETPGTATSPGAPKPVPDPDFSGIKIIHPLVFDDLLPRNLVLKHMLTRDLEATVLATLNYMDKGTSKDPRFGWQLFFRGLGEQPLEETKSLLKRNEQGWLEGFWQEQKALFDDAVLKVTERILIEDTLEIVPWLLDRSLKQKKLLTIQNEALEESIAGLPAFIKRLTEWGSVDSTIVDGIPLTPGYYLDGVAISIADGGEGMYKDLFQIQKQAVDQPDLLKTAAHATAEYTNVIHNGLTGDTQASTRGIIPILQPTQTDAGARLVGIFTNPSPLSIFPLKSKNVASLVPAIPLIFTQMPGPAAVAAPSAPDPKLPGPPADNTVEPGILIR